MCGMFFDAADQLKLHRMRYCQGSALHQAMLATREENRGAVAARLEEDPLHLLNTNLACQVKKLMVFVGELCANGEGGHGTCQRGSKLRSPVQKHG